MTAATPLAAAGRIGPNAVLQLLPLMEALVGSDATQALMAMAGLPAPPGDQGLMDERPAAALHRLLRSHHPTQAPRVLRMAGIATADYILAHRIPAAAQALLRWLPAPLAAPLLLTAVGRHAWTFSGSGSFRIESLRPLVVSLTDNPLIAGETAPEPLCDWHCAVFERLFRQLVADRYRCTETGCQAAGADRCRFIIS